MDIILVLIIEVVYWVKNKLLSPETSILTRATRRHIPQNRIHLSNGMTTHKKESKFRVLLITAILCSYRSLKDLVPLILQRGRKAS
jgi:hypothetical protein